MHWNKPPRAFKTATDIQVPNWEWREFSVLTKFKTVRQREGSGSVPGQAPHNRGYGHNRSNGRKSAADSAATHVQNTGEVQPTDVGCYELSMKARGSVLVGLLWCVAILSILVVGVLHTSTLDLRVAKNQGDLIQAHYLALAGVEKAKALLFLEARDRRSSRKNHTGELYDAPQHFRDVALGRGQFRVFRQGREDENQAIVYGINDEESRLNVNHASTEELGKLEGMTSQMAAAIHDYRDGDRTAGPGGAEVEEYAALQSPYAPRDGPLRTTRELLMVLGIPRDLVAGEDANLNGLLDPEENDGNDTDPPDNQDGQLDGGWHSLITVDSSVRNVSAAGTRRENIQTAEESALAGVDGISEDLAKAIVQYRNQTELESLADLLDVTAVRNENQSGSPQRPGSNASRASSASNASGNTAAPAPQNFQGSGEKLISQDLLQDVADDLTAEDEQNLPGAVNINTASARVLACLPGLNEELAQAIVSYRRSSGFFPNIACLLNVSGITPQVFKQAAPRVTARSETFRILSEGSVPSTGARKRMEVIVQVGSSYIDTLAYREDL